MVEPLPMRATRAGALVHLASPAVGLFTEAARRGEVLTPGSRAGVIVTLGRAAPLLVPPGVAGVVRSERPEAVRAPVDHGTVLYELEGLETLGAEKELLALDEDRADAGGPVFRCPQAGRLWHRPAPDEPPLVEAGRTIEPGAPVGLIEVMKTFTHVVYRPGSGLPERARVVRVLAADGVEVAQGEALFEVEPA